MLAHLVGQVGQQVKDKVSHPLDKLLQGLKGGAVQHKLLCLQIDHDLINIWGETLGSITDFHLIGT